MESESRFITLIINSVALKEALLVPNVLGSGSRLSLSLATSRSDLSARNQLGLPIEIFKNNGLYFYSYEKCNITFFQS
jgi:hypothetical protein